VLLERGANPNAQLKLRPKYRNIPYDRYRDPLMVWGTTTLLRAAKAGDVAVVKLLLEHGALANLPNSIGSRRDGGPCDGHITIRRVVTK
jgi:ankyrin repeat protein